MRGNDGWVLAISRICQHYLDKALIRRLGRAIVAAHAPPWVSSRQEAGRHSFHVGASSHDFGITSRPCHIHRRTRCKYSPRAAHTPCRRLPAGCCGPSGQLGWRSLACRPGRLHFSRGSQTKCRNHRYGQARHRVEVPDQFVSSWRFHPLPSRRRKTGSSVRNIPARRISDIRPGPVRCRNLASRGQARNRRSRNRTRADELAWSSCPDSGRMLRQLRFARGRTTDASAFLPSLTPVRSIRSRPLFAFFEPSRRPS